jgi:voltage-gated potassium channel
MHLVEGEEQPMNFGTIPRAIWWATVTLTTVGYGDVVPITIDGRIFGIVILISGIGMAALPAGILAAGFTKEIQRRKELFRNKAISFLSDGILDKNEQKKLRILAHDLGIPAQYVKNIIWDLERLQLKITELNCPHCNNPIEIEHYSDNIKIRHKKSHE